METKTYIVERVTNGFILKSTEETQVFNGADAIAKDLADGLFSRLPKGAKLEFSSKIISNGDLRK